jgi:hypothetical protein
MKQQLDDQTSVSSRERFPRFFARFVVAVVLVLCAGYGWLFYDDDIQVWWHRAPFEQAEWQAARNPALGEYRRLGMVDDVLANKHRFVGLAGGQLRDLLGPPDQEGRSDDEHDLLYTLGVRGFSIEWLVVDIGHDGRVVDLFIVRD